MYKIFTVLLTLSSIQTSPIIQSQSLELCSHQFSEALPLDSSSWGVFLESGLLTPAQDNTNHHVKRLKHKLAELVAIIDFHKEDYTQNMFGASYNQIDTELGDLHYPEVIPEGFPILQGSDYHILSQSSVLEAYSIFQRLAISIEVVTIDHTQHKQAINKIWRMSRITVDNILRNIYTEMVMKGISIPAPLTRNIIPDTMRCLPFSAYRDTRDFLLLRHILQAAMIFSSRLDV